MAANHKNPFDGTGHVGAILRWLASYPYGFTARDLQHHLNIKHKQSSSALTHCQKIGLVFRDNEAYPRTRYSLSVETLNVVPPKHLQGPPFKTSRKQTERDRIRREKYKNSVNEKRKQYTVQADASAKFHKSLPRTPPSLDLPTLLHHNGLLP